MTVEEAYKTLINPKMAKLECNFKVKNTKPDNNIPGWFKKFHKEEFKSLQKAVIDLNTKPPKYFLDFQKQMLDFVKEQRQFNQSIIDQFKKHGWIK